MCGRGQGQGQRQHRERASQTGRQADTKRQRRRHGQQSACSLASAPAARTGTHFLFGVSTYSQIVVMMEAQKKSDMYSPTAAKKRVNKIVLGGGGSDVPGVAKVHGRSWCVPAVAWCVARGAWCVRGAVSRRRCGQVCRRSGAPQHCRPWTRSGAHVRGGGGLPTYLAPAWVPRGRGLYQVQVGVCAASRRCWCCRGCRGCLGWFGRFGWLFAVIILAGATGGRGGRRIVPRSGRVGRHVDVVNRVLALG